LWHHILLAKWRIPKIIMQLRERQQSRTTGRYRLLVAHQSSSEKLCTKIWKLDAILLPTYYINGVRDKTQLQLQLSSLQTTPVYMLQTAKRAMFWERSSAA
jgi:hypothetical protein